MSAKRLHRPMIPQTPERADLEGLRGEISEALTRFPIDDPSLRRAVWAYADAELRLGTPLGYVIVVLTELVDTASVAPFSVGQARMRQLTLWTIERYFGNFDVSGETNRKSDPAAVARVSSRSEAR